jgi:hypothetical protein
VLHRTLGLLGSHRCHRIVVDERVLQGRAHDEEQIVVGRTEEGVTRGGRRVVGLVGSNAKSSFDMRVKVSRMKNVTKCKD